MFRHASHGSLSLTFIFLFILEPTVPCDKSGGFFNATDNGMKKNNICICYICRFTLVQLMPLTCPTKNTPIPCLQTQLSLSHLFSAELIICSHMNRFLQGLLTFVRLELCNTFISSHPPRHTHKQHVRPSQVCCFKANIFVVSRGWEAAEGRKKQKGVSANSTSQRLWLRERYRPALSRLKVLIIPALYCPVNNNGSQCNTFSIKFKIIMV